MDRDQTNSSLFNDDPVLQQHGCTISKAKARLKLQLSWGVPRHGCQIPANSPGKWTGSINLDVNVFGSIDAALQIRDNSISRE